MLYNFIYCQYIIIYKLIAQILKRLKRERERIPFFCNHQTCGHNSFYKGDGLMRCMCAEDIYDGCVSWSEEMYNRDVLAGMRKYSTYKNTKEMK